MPESRFPLNPLAPGISPLQIDPARALLPEGTGGAGILAGEAAHVAAEMWEQAESWEDRARALEQQHKGKPVSLRPTPQEIDFAADLLGGFTGSLGVGGREGVLSAAAKAPVRRMTQVPNIRELPVKDAVKLARQEPHLIPNKGGEGFVGGPPGIKNREDLLKLRRAFDKYIAQDPQGGTWYERYRAAIAEVTGNNAADNQWLSSALAQWSAGVAPEVEAQFALKESNAAIAGMPVKASRPAQHEAHMRAIANQDPSEYLLGKKTSQYQRFISPDQGVPGATGVNDFRYARQWGYPTISGQTSQGGVGVGGATAHTWLDYETALAVDRANRKKLGGRGDWTGEQLQAVPWVRQKGEALAKRASKKDPQGWEAKYPEKYAKANTTFGDFLDKHTAFATHEAQPGAQTGHLPGSVAATQAEREAFAADPRSHWMDPTGRDVIYSEMRIPDTGVAMRVRPTAEMQGVYQTPEGVLETNRGWTARPLVAFDPGKVKSVPEADRSLLSAGEAFRGYVDVENAAAWHKPWLGGQVGKSNSLFIPFDRKLTEGEVLQLKKELEPYGIGDIVDTGKGVTATRFYPEPEKLSTKRGVEALTKAKGVLGTGTGARAALSGDFIDYVPAWAAGKGAATRQMLEYVTKTPGIRAAFNNNKYIPQKALDRLERDEEWRAKWGAPRDDVQNARRIIGAGPGWIDRLEAALKDGSVSLPVVAAVLATAALVSQEQEQQPGRAQQ